MPYLTLRADLLAIARFYDIDVPEQVAAGSFLGLCDFLFRRYPAQQRQAFERWQQEQNDKDKTLPL
ncbi:hypothetical protein 2B_00002 [Ralstonia phage Bakoly]|nr:hypothetical protein KE333_gp02 [Ralstonia phage Bakoly]QMV32575.1 hypothetical protein 2B_00002 [Ralstonia phage Bakoly]QMV33568.1 hypothetical protein 30B_00061 [Ralstonia phage Jenny]